MEQRPRKSSKNLIWIMSAVVALAILGGGFYVVKILISDGGSGKGRQMHMVTLLKLPPPPPIREKPPEPKVEEKKEIIKTEPDQQPQADEQADDKPAGEQLGVDADGSAGSDAFGLVAKKGGRPLIGGSSGDQSLLRKYAWYTQFLEEEIRKRVREHLDRHGGIPQGNLKTIVRVTLNGRGNIADHSIVASSGSHKMDTAVSAALKTIQLSEPPPEGMPTSLKLRISSQG